jgi:hypothetical protein
MSYRVADARIDATATLLGARGIFTLSLHGVSGAIVAGHESRTGHWRVCGGTNAYSRLRGEGRWQADADFGAAPPGMLPHPLGGADDRRDRAEGPLLRRRAGRHDRRAQGAARAVGRLDGEQDRHRAPALRPRRPRVRCRAGRARRPRRIQGTQGRRQRGLRARPGAAVRAPQGTQRARAPPERDRPAVKQRLRRAWATDDHALALDGLKTLAAELDRSHPDAASSLREGLEETLSVTRLGIRGRLKRTLQSTNPASP